MATSHPRLKHFECPVCMELMDLNKKPKVLPCQHTVCEMCVDGCNNKCPICRKDFCQTSQELPTNLTLIQFQDVMMSKSVPSNKDKCDFCIETVQDITHHCNECNDYFCSSCATKHPDNPVHEGHQPVPLSISICSNHKRGFTMFCLDCNMLLCSVCVHRGMCCTSNNKTKLEDIKTSKTQELERMIKRISAEMKEKSYHPNTEMLASRELNILDVTNKIKTHSQNLRDYVNQREEILLKHVENCDKIIHQQREVETKIQEAYEMLAELKETAETALTTGIETILLTLPFIESVLPQTALNKVNIIIPGKIRFESEVTIAIGKLSKEKDIIAVSDDCDDTVEMHIFAQDEHVYRLLQTVSINAKKGAMGNDLCDIVFMKESMIAITDYIKKVVFLVDRQGNVMATSHKQGVEFKGLRCIAYHLKLDCLVVCDGEAGCLYMLHPNTLSLVKKVQLNQFSPWGVAVMLNGNIVITDDMNKKVNVLDMNGTQLYSWNSYNSANSRFSYPWYVTVDRDNNIYIADYSDKKIVKLSEIGELLCVWKTEGWPRGLALYDNKVLVVERDSLDKPPDRVREYHEPKQPGRCLVTWNKECGHQLGWIRSIAINQDQLAVISQKGLNMYTITSTTTRKMMIWDQ